MVLLSSSNLLLLLLFIIVKLLLLLLLSFLHKRRVSKLNAFYRKQYWKYLKFVLHFRLKKISRSCKNPGVDWPTKQTHFRIDILRILVYSRKRNSRNSRSRVPHTLPARGREGSVYLWPCYRLDRPKRDVVSRASIRGPS